MSNTIDKWLVSLGFTPENFPDLYEQHPELYELVEQ